MIRISNQSCRGGEEERTTVEIKYRYFATDDAEFDDGSVLEFESHNIYLGLRFTF